MEFKSTQKRPKLGHRPIGDSHTLIQTGNYKQKLLMYQIPPVETISLLEFEDLAIQRLKILKAVEEEGLRHTKGSKEYSFALTKAIDAIGLFENPNADDEKRLEGRRRDHISHFILRLAFCRTTSGKAWLVQQETDLFKLRLSSLTSMECGRFLEANDLDYEMMGVNEDAEVGAAVRAASGGWASRDEECCKVPFTEALDYVRGRRCYLSAGFAYILRSEITALVAARFRTHLSLALATASKYFGYIQEEERLGSFLKKINAHTYVGKDFTDPSKSGTQVSLADIPKLAPESFPLCMQSLYRSLKANHHLKHGGRQQLGLFLKGLGLTLEEALQFWRTEFKAVVDADKFDKNYAYNIRHNYGKEGRRKDYAPYSCTKIICSNPPGPGDVHGCPFKHSDVEVLRQSLKALRLTPPQLERVLELKGQGLFDHACSRVLEFTHGLREGDLAQLVSHPNHYFLESRAYRTGEKTNQTIGESQGIDVSQLSQSLKEKEDGACD